MPTTTLPRRISLHPTPPPPPSPNILLWPLPRRVRPKQLESTATHHSRSNKIKNNNTLLLHQHYLTRKLESLFDQEVLPDSELFQSTEIVDKYEDKELGEGENPGESMFQGGKWRFQAEILRAQCNFLRMEREFSMKKLERNRVKTERTMKSAVQTLVSGREKVESPVNARVESCQVRKSSNFDKKACVLQRRLKKTNVNRNVDKSRSMSDAGVKNNKRIDHFSKVSAMQLYQDQMPHDEQKCTGRCKAIVQKIVQQVRSETEQWSQMQEMLGQVRGEMEELQTSRDYWENRALDSDCEIQSLRQTVEEWRDKALSYENKASELQAELEELQLSKEKLHSSRCRDTIQLQELSPGQIQKEKNLSSFGSKENHHMIHIGENTRNAKHELSRDESRRTAPTKKSPPVTLWKQLAKEKQIRTCRLKEDCHTTKDCGEQKVRASWRQKIFASSKGLES